MGGVEGQDADAIMRLYGLSRNNLCQICKRLTAKLCEMVAQVHAEMDAPGMSGGNSSAKISSAGLVLCYNIRAVGEQFSSSAKQISRAGVATAFSVYGVYRDEVKQEKEK